MIDALQRASSRAGLWKWIIAVLVLTAAVYLGLHPSRRWLMLLVGAMLAAILLAQPVLGLFALVLAALVVPMELSTGTEVSLNLATVLVPALVLAWIVNGVAGARSMLAPSRVNPPLLAFVVASLLSLLAGNALWDPAVPRPTNLLAVQFAQWAIFAFSAGAFWLGANVTADQGDLRRLTFLFLAVGGGLAVVRVLPGLPAVTERVATIASRRAPFWMLLASLAGGQLLFNPLTPKVWQGFLLLVVASAIAYGFVLARESASTWVAVGSALSVLAWLRWPRLRWPVLVLLAALTTSGLLFSAVWEFAGGRPEWLTTGAPRLVLISRVVGVTMRNPVTGLGPASYRAYANLEPLSYRQITWMTPSVSSHNNYVDVFAHTGIVGLVLFVWFVAEVGRLGLRLRRRFERGFLAGYVNGMLAAGAASLVVMLLADWILPFVYNIGFPGFQASVLVWLFMGGLVMVAQRTGEEEPA